MFYTLGICFQACLAILPAKQESSRLWNKSCSVNYTKSLKSTDHQPNIKSDS